MKIVNNFLDTVLPVFGNAKANIPIYNEAQKMFITSNYTSAAGHLYYKGIRFSERLVMVEQVGLYHNWTYIDGIELYAYSGTERILIAKKQFDKVYYNMDLIQNEVRKMLFEYFKSQVVLNSDNTSMEVLENQADQTIGTLYENKIEQIARFLKQPEMQTLLQAHN